MSFKEIATQAGVIQPESDRSYALSEVASRLGVCITTVRGEIGAGRLHAVKVRRRTVVPATALANYLASRPAAELSAA